MKYLNKTFSYCFKNSNKEYPAILKMNLIKDNFLIKDGANNLKVKSVKVQHGKVDSVCYIFDKKLAYISDVSTIHKKDYKFFKKLKYLVIDCLWYKNHPSHLNLEQSLKLIKIFSPKKAILTNLHSELDYKILKKKLPKNIVPAYDGLNLYF